MKIQVLELRAINLTLQVWKDENPINFDTFPDTIKQAITENAEKFILDGNQYKTIEDVALYDPYHTQFDKYEDALKKKAAMTPAIYLRQSIFEQVPRKRMSIDKQNELFHILNKTKYNLEAYNEKNN